MKIKEAKFIKSANNLKDCPEDSDIKEYAFIGRSNVGKSSLINSLLGIKGIAKTSVTPGKTQTLNYFLVNNAWYLVDLPGVGYAKTSKTNIKNWEKLIENYMLKRKQLFCVFYLVDSKIPLQQIDAEFMRFLGEWNIPFVIVFTKTDKLKVSQVNLNIENYKKIMLQDWEAMPEYFITSAKTHLGKQEILNYIEELN